jgi:hypothetical protein
LKAALIPPVPELTTFGVGDFHLLLSHLVDEYPKYATHYINERRRGAYLVLDNSAHERERGESASVLARQACALAVQEVVVPDKLFDAEGTVDGAVAAMEEWFEHGKFTCFSELSPCLMYVPQGREEDDWLQCFAELLRIQAYVAKARLVREHFVIGLSKDYEVWEGGLAHLLEAYINPARESLLFQGIKMQVHLLGWGRDLWQLPKLARRFPWIRSTDSAKPFVYALHKMKLTGRDTPEYPGRPKNYFSRRLQRDPEVFSCAWHNAEMFRAMAA